MASFTFRSLIMVIETLQYEEGTWPGLQIIVDFEGVTLSHFAKIDVFDMQRFLYYLQVRFICLLLYNNYANDTRTAVKHSSWKIQLFNHIF